MTWAIFDYQKYHKITVLQHRSVCYTIPRLPFVCDLHHQLAYTNVHGIEKAYNKYFLYSDNPVSGHINLSFSDIDHCSLTAIPPLWLL